ncbi:MAG: LysR family transcriptional regulator [Pseudomonadota bacterium]
MDLRQLRHFIAVADCGTYSAASDALNLTQPALTRSIQTLEDQLQSSLFTRQPRGVTLTDAGTALLRHARLMLHQAQAAREEVSSITGGRAGQLSIGLAPMFSSTVIDKVLIEMNEQFPDLRFSVTTALISDLLRQLADASLDVVLANIPAGPLPSEIVHEVLFETRSYVLVGAAHPLAHKPHIDLADLRSAAWATVRQQSNLDAVGDMLFGGIGEQITPAIETNSLQLLRTILLSGQFVSVLAEHWLHDDLKAGRIVRLKVKGTPITRPAGVLMRHAPSRQASVSLFVAQARKFSAEWAGERA